MRSKALVGTAERRIFPRHPTDDARAPDSSHNFVASAFRLDGRVAAVTGGASGLGAAISAGLVQAGATVVVLDVDSGRASGVAAEIAKDGNALALACDVTDKRSVEAAVAAIVDRAGPSMSS